MDSDIETKSKTGPAITLHESRDDVEHQHKREPEVPGTAFA